MFPLISSILTTKHYSLKLLDLGTFWVIQWLKLLAPSAGGPGSISGQGARSHMLQLRPRAALPRQKKHREPQLPEAVEPVKALKGPHLIQP